MLARKGKSLQVNCMGFVMHQLKKKGYGAVVFLCMVTMCASYVRFVSSKTRVAPLSEQTIPRLELLSAVVLSRLIHSME